MSCGICGQEHDYGTVDPMAEPGPAALTNAAENLRRMAHEGGDAVTASDLRATAAWLDSRAEAREAAEESA